jgi:hypothetical protein
MQQPMLFSSCKQYAGQPENNSEQEVKQIEAALSKVAAESGLDQRYLLAIMMQESKGCVRAPTTNYGQENPGLFQSFNGQGSCNRDNVNFKTPCPESDILLMVREGAGIGRPFGLMQAMQQAGANDDSKYYKAARIYNSGSIAASGNLGDGIATHCYASDIANRLVGWPNDDAHKSACQEHAIGGVQGGNSAYDGPEYGNGNQGNTDPPKPKPNTPNTPSNPPPTNNNPNAPKADGAVGNCKKWHTVKQGDHCSNLPVSFDTLRKLNTKLDGTCSNLWLGYAYCIGT